MRRPFPNMPWSTPTPGASYPLSMKVWTRRTRKCLRTSVVMGARARSRRRRSSTQWFSWIWPHATIYWRITKRRSKRRLYLSRTKRLWRACTVGARRTLSSRTMRGRLRTWRMLWGWTPATKMIYNRRLCNWGSKRRRLTRRATRSWRDSCSKEVNDH